VIIDETTKEFYPTGYELVNSIIKERKPVYLSLILRDTSSKPENATRITHELDISTIFYTNYIILRNGERVMRARPSISFNLNGIRVTSIEATIGTKGQSTLESLYVRSLEPQFSIWRCPSDKSRKASHHISLNEHQMNGRMRSELIFE